MARATGASARPPCLGSLPAAAFTCGTMRHFWRHSGSRKFLARAGAALAVCALAGAFLLLALAQQRGRPAAQRPRRVTSGATAGTIRVRAGDDLQAAINDARPGDEVVLDAGASWRGTIVLPRKAGGAGGPYVTIRSSAIDALPPAGGRVSPSDAPRMPKLLAPGAGEPALRTAPGAHHYRLIGLEITSAPRAQRVTELVQFGDGLAAQNKLESVPHDLVLDRCFVHGDAEVGARRGVALNSGRAEITGCHISDCMGRGEDTQAVMGWNGPGPFRIANNRLEGAGENIMFGGADPSIPNLVPSDIEVVGNHLTKPLSWRGRWTVKNLFELKNARRVRVEGNLMENNWLDAQEGTAILFTPRNQGGAAPWSTVEDVLFTNNIVRHTSSAIYLLGRDNLQPSRQARNITVSNNLFTDVGGERWGGRGIFLLISGTAGVRVEHNTVLHSGNVTAAFGDPNTGFIFRDNLVLHNAYGFHGDGRAPGNDAINFYFPGADVSHNAIVGGNADLYKGRNMFPVSLKHVRFAGAEIGDYRLRPDSPLKRAASDATDIGADVDRLPREFLGENRP